MPHVAYGDRIAGTLADVLLDTTTPAAVRRQIPRVFQQIPTQRSVDALFQAYDEPDLSVRTAALKSSAIREQASKLNFGRESLRQHISREARYYYETAASRRLQGQYTRNSGGTSSGCNSGSHALRQDAGTTFPAARV